MHKKINIKNIRLQIKERCWSYLVANTSEPILYSISSKNRYKKYVKFHICRALLSMIFTYGISLIFAYDIVERVGFSNLFYVNNLSLLFSIIVVFAVNTITVAIAIKGEINVYKLYKLFEYGKINSLSLYRFSSMTQLWSMEFFLLLHIITLSVLIQSYNFPLQYVFVSIFFLMPISIMIGVIVGKMWINHLLKISDIEIKKAKRFSAKEATLIVVPLITIIQASLGHKLYVISGFIVGLYVASYIGYQLYLTKVSFELFKHNLLGFEKEPVIRKKNEEEKSSY